MTIRMLVRPEYSEDDYTVVWFEGNEEESVANVLAARLRGADWDVLVDTVYDSIEDYNGSST